MSKQPRSAEDEKRADDVLDRMFINLKLPKPSNPPFDEVREVDEDDKPQS